MQVRLGDKIGHIPLKCINIEVRNYTRSILKDRCYVNYYRGIDNFLGLGGLISKDKIAAILLKG